MHYENNKMSFDHNILCVGNDKLEYTFCYSITESEEDGNSKWIFRVMPSDLNATDWYEFAITKVNSHIGKVTMMDNRNMPVYRGKGITEKLIEVASNDLGIEIRSSSNKKKTFSNEFRTTAADVIWNRLVVKGKAEYNEELDFYKYNG